MAGKIWEFLSWVIPVLCALMVIGRHGQCWWRQKWKVPMICVKCLGLFSVPPLFLVWQFRKKRKKKNMLPFRSQALISLVTHTASILEKVFEYTPNQTLFHFNRTRQERKSTTLEWRRNALSGYVREPSGVLTLTVLSSSYHTVPYTAFLTDFTPTNSAIRIIPSYVKSWSTAINRRGSRIYLFKASIFKSFLFLSFLKGNTQVVPFHVWYRLDRVCPLELSRYTNNQILLHQDQHIIGKATLSSSPWHHSFPPYPQPSVAQLSSCSPELQESERGPADGSQQWSA